MSAGAWARDIARTYDALAENFESRPSTPENTLGAIANRAEAAKYHSIAARMDATGLSDRVAQQPAERCSMCRGGVSHSARDTMRGSPRSHRGRRHSVAPPRPPRRN